MVLPLKGSSGNRRYDRRVGYFVHMTENFLLSVGPVDIKCTLHIIIHSKYFPVSDLLKPDA